MMHFANVCTNTHWDNVYGGGGGLVLIDNWSRHTHNLWQCVFLPLEQIEKQDLAEAGQVRR